MEHDAILTLIPTLQGIGIPLSERIVFGHDPLTHSRFDESLDIREMSNVLDQSTLKTSFVSPKMAP